MVVQLKFNDGARLAAGGSARLLGLACIKLQHFARNKRVFQFQVYESPNYKVSIRWEFVSRKTFCWREVILGVGERL